MGILDMVPEGSPERVEYNLQYCSLTLIFFDYILTMNDEIEYVWKERWRTSTLFYMLCRYALVTNVLYVISVSERFPSISCQTGYTICGILSIFGRIGILGVWGLRTYAIYEKSRAVLCILAPLGCAGLISAVVQVPVMRCQPQDEHPVFRTVTSACMIAFEVLAFVLASIRLWTSLNEEGPAARLLSLRRKKTLHAIVFRQGFLYILAVVGLSVASMTLNITAWKGSFLQRLLNGVKVPLSGFLTARFILRLRKWDRYRKDVRDFTLPLMTTTEHMTATTGPPTPPPQSLGADVQQHVAPAAESPTDRMPGPSSKPYIVVSPPSCSRDPGPSRLPPELDRILTEFGDDIGPQLPEDIPKEEEDYEWDWDNIDPEDMARWRSERRAMKSSQISPQGSLSPSPSRSRKCEDEDQDNLAAASSSSACSMPPVSLPVMLIGRPQTPSRTSRERDVGSIV